MNFTIDLYDTIGNYLSYIKHYSLLTLDYNINNKFVISKFQDNFKSQFCKYLKKFVDDPEEFCSKLKENNCVVSGSFILDCLYDTQFSNDIDIFAKVPNNDNIDIYNAPTSEYSHFAQVDEKNFGFLIYLKKIGAANINTDVKFNRFNRNHNPHIVVNITRHSLFNTRNYELNNKKIQYIMTTKNPKDFIDNIFDLDICKNYFDGEKLYIKNFAKLDGKYDYHKPLNGAAKYLYQSETDNTAESRMQKYIDRGFNIHKHDKFDEIENSLNELIENYRNTYNLGNTTMEIHNENLGEIYKKLSEFSKL